MSGRMRWGWTWLVVGGLGLTAWALRRRRRGREATLTMPERAVERGKDAAGVVAETTAELTRPPGTNGPLA